MGSDLYKLTLCLICGFRWEFGQGRLEIEGGYGQSEEASDQRPHGRGPLKVDFWLDL
jgi:hypothetical protein